MRLICPACKTVYEAPDGAVPAAGRMVRCSNCRAEWLARPRASERAPMASAPKTTFSPPPAPAAPRDPVPSIERVAPVAPAAVPAPAEKRAEPSPSTAATPAVPSPETPGEHPSSAPVAPETRADALIRSLETEEAPQAASGGRFMAGFATVSLIALAAVAVYARHDDLARALPTLAGPLGDYVAFVDRAREALADGVAGLRSGG
jgi:predicted Zn finger-like uncharacterized protein